MFELGFLGTRAPLYLDVVGLFFLLLPLFLFISIRFAIKGEIKKHLVSQMMLFVTMLVMVIVFEVGMRLSGGFLEYMKESSLSFSFMVFFLIVHIFIAIMTVLTWAYQLIASVKAYRSMVLTAEFRARHKYIGKLVSIGILITVAMGAYIYYALFIA